MGKQCKQWETIFSGSKITADGDCSHEIKRRLLLGRKVMTNLDSILESRDITLPTKVRLVKAMVFLVVMYGCESWTIKKKNWCFWTVVLEKTLESPLDCKEIKLVSPKEKSVLNIHWKDQCWKWSSNTLATWHKELTHLKRPWCWEGLRAGGEGEDRGLDGWMASLTQWTWVWIDFGSWWRTGRPDILRFMGSQRVGHDWVTKLNWILLQRLDTLARTIIPLHVRGVLPSCLPPILLFIHPSINLLHLKIGRIPIVIQIHSFSLKESRIWQQQPGSHTALALGQGWHPQPTSLVQDRSSELPSLSALVWPVCSPSTHLSGGKQSAIPSRETTEIERIVWVIKGGRFGSWTMGTR